MHAIFWRSSPTPKWPGLRKGAVFGVSSRHTFLLSDESLGKLWDFFLGRLQYRI